MFKIKENDIFKKNMSQGELYKVYKTFKAKQEMDKFLNKLITKNGVTKYQYDKEIRKQVGGSNSTHSNNNSNNNSKMMKYPKVLGWSVVIGMWAMMGVGLNQIKKSEQQKKENIEVIAEGIIEWMHEDVENDRIPEWTAKEYINDLEQIIKETK